MTNSEFSAPELLRVNDDEARFINHVGGFIKALRGNDIVILSNEQASEITLEIDITAA
jgi:hypothetical protein